MNARISKATRMLKHDHEGIILDLLDDIVSAEARAQTLVDRLDMISKRPGIKVVDVDMYLWIVAAIAIVGCAVGVVLGFLLRRLIL